MSNPAAIESFWKSLAVSLGIGTLAGLLLWALFEIVG